MSKQIVFGGYAVKNDLCRTRNDYDPTVPDELADPPSEAAQHRMDDGIEFEDEVELAFKAMHDIDAAPNATYDELIGHPALGEYRTNADGHLTEVYLVGDRSKDGKRLREEASLLAMELGVAFIWNPRLPATFEDEARWQAKVGRIGEPDFMSRFGEAPDADGTWLYVPGDVKHHKVLSGSAKPRAHRVYGTDQLALGFLEDNTSSDDELGKGSARKEDALQLAHYTLMLEALGHALPEGERLGLLLGKEDGIVLVHDLDEASFLKATPQGRRKKSAIEYYLDDFDAHVDVALAASANTEEAPVTFNVGLTKKTACVECPWASYCNTVRKVTDDVSRVIGVTASQAELHAARGVRTAADLARLDVATAMLVDAGLDASEVLERARRMSPERPAVLVLADAPEADAATKTMTDRQPWLLDQLEQAGVTTAGDLAGLCDFTAAYSEVRPQRLVEQIDRARVLTVGKPHLARGAEFVDVKRASIELHVDIEDNNGDVYLIGVNAYGKARTGKASEKRRREYHAFRTWETTEEALAKVLADFWAYVTTMQGMGKVNKWGVKGYCYTHHERSTLLKQAARFHDDQGNPIVKGVPSVAELQEFFDSSSWVDVHEVVSDTVLFPTEDIKLKTIATQIAGFVWRDEDPSGGNSMAWYAEAVDADEDEDVRKASQSRLLDYNEDDCAATFHILEWLSLNGDARQPGAALPSVAKLDRYFRQMRHPAPSRTQPELEAAA